MLTPVISAISALVLCSNSTNGPKRILALDGGGLRGILSVAVLQKIENLLRAQHGNNSDFQLSHYFDLIAGTSTGAIIAAALAQGWTVEEIRSKYMNLGRDVFRRNLSRWGFIRAKYNEEKLITELKKVYGASTTLGDDKLQTGLLVMTKRLDTGSLRPQPKGEVLQFSSVFSGDTKLNSCRN